MKFKGKVQNWNDSKGFGFVEPNGGGARAFVHIKAFKHRSRRPVNGEVINYKLVRESNNQYKAEDIKFAREAKNSSKSSKVKSSGDFGSSFTGYLTIGFCVGLLITFSSGKLSVIVVGLYIVMSSITFITYAIDKAAAQNGRRRIQEKTLHLISLFGGWPGALFAQRILRHKSSKKEFRRIYWLTVLLNACGLYWVHTEKGAQFLTNVILPLLNGW